MFALTELLKGELADKENYEINLSNELTLISLRILFIAWYWLRLSTMNLMVMQKRVLRREASPQNSWRESLKGTKYFQCQKTSVPYGTDGT